MPHVPRSLARLTAPSRRASRLVLRTLAAALVAGSLLLCLTTTVVWVRSYRRWDNFCWYDRVGRTAPLWQPGNDFLNAGTSYALTIDAGRVSVTRTRSWPAGRLPVEAWHATGAAPRNDWRPVRSLWNRLGFHDFSFGNAGNAFSDNWRTVAAPLWLPCVATAAPPAAWLLRRRRRRVPPGHCRHCGYDLTGNVSGVCPECGNAGKCTTPGNVLLPFSPSPFSPFAPLGSPRPERPTGLPPG